MQSAAGDLQRLVELAEASDEAVWLVDVETGDYLHVNANAAALMHEDLAALRRGNAFDFAPRLADVARRRWQALVERSPIATQEDTIFVRRDGSGASVRATRQAVRAGGRWVVFISARPWSGQPARETAYAELVAVVTEREETSRRSAQVQRRGEYLVAALNHAADAIFMIDAQSHAYVEVNESAAKLFGVARQSILERGAASIIHEVALSPYDQCRSLAEVDAMMTRVYGELIATQPQVVTDLQTLAPSGRLRITIESRRQAVQMDGRWLIIVVARDVTEREAHRQRLERVYSAFDQAADAIVVVDPDTGRYAEANAAATSLFGAIRGEPLAGPGADEWPRLCVQAIAAHPGEVTALRELSLASSGIRHVETTRRAIRVDERWLVVSTTRDITDRTRAERELTLRLEELRRSNRDLEQFAYVASHDLSEPLRMIGSYTQLLSRRYTDRLDEEGREFMGYVVSGARRMKQLIDDLLVYSRAARPGELSPTPLDAALDEALARLGPAVAASGARVERTPLPTLPADPLGMTQLFEHLVGNAVKFRADAPPTIRITAARQGAKWQFEVSDNGIGIAARYHERIFVIFQRLHGFEHYEGNGIGLAVCKKIVERHGGTIDVRSEPGAGATFRFTLPAGDAPAAN
jgi:PAS domain S-box-containing protein